MPDRSLPAPAAPLLAWLLVAALGAAPASAQPKEVPPMPTAVDATDLDRDFERIRNTPFADPELAYELAVPRGWQDETEAPSSPDSYEAPVSLGCWRKLGDPERSPEIEVSCALLPFDMPAEAWLDQLARKLEFEVLKRQVGTGAAGRMAELLVRLKTDGGARVLRLSAFASGERLFLVTGMATEPGYPVVARELAAAALSFRLLSPAPPRPAPAPADYRIEQPFPVALAVPADWVIEGGDKLIEGHGVAWVRPPQSSGLRAHLRIHLASNEFPLDEQGAIEMALAQAKAGGFTPDRVLLELPAASPAPGVPAGRFCLIEGRDPDRAMELRVLSFDTGGGRLTISGYCPSHAAAPDSWRACTAALDALLKSIKL
ncbi:MAG: hypothetical protein HZA54_14030 [Planctomycetes bacterium]|nr:hypothetical protein [Planctomycetota bacterium]